MSTILKNPKFRYIVTPAIGFGLGGAIWGWDIYRGAIESNEAFINPFSFISGAFSFGILGSLSLAIYSGDMKKILKVVGVGLVGWIAAFLLPLLFGYYLFIVGGIITPFIGIISILTDIDPAVFLSLPNSVIVGHRWAEFLLTGIIIGLVYGLLLKKSLVRVSLVVGVGLAFGSLISPVAGNLLNSAANSLLAVFITTFLLLGAISGLVIGYSLREKPAHDS